MMTGILGFHGVVISILDSESNDPSSSLGGTSRLPGGASGKEPTCQCRRYKVTLIQSLGWGDPLEEGMGTHSCIIAWRIPWTEEPGGLVYRVAKSWTRLK